LGHSAGLLYRARSDGCLIAAGELRATYEDRHRLTPAAGHVNPIAAIGRILVAEGHEVIGLSGNAFRKRFEDIGARFHLLPASANPDFQNIASFVPELNSLPDGTPRLVRSRIILGRAFIDTIPLQHDALQQILRDVHVDVIIGDNGFLGVLPMLLKPGAKRTPIVLCGTSILIWKRPDGAPNFAGLPPATNEAQRKAYAAIARERDKRTTYVQCEFFAS